MNKAFFESYYQTYNSENPEALRAFYHDDVELISAQGVMKGPDEIIATYREITANFTDQMTPREINIQEGVAKIDIHDQFTAKREVADFMGMAFTKGQGFEMELQGEYEVENNKIKKITLSMS